jgi:hypothetical protein
MANSEHRRILDQIDNDLKAWGKRRKAFASDSKFAVIGGKEQWEPSEWARREKLKLPRITYNICMPVVRRVANAIASKAYSVEIVPAGTGALAEMAELRASMIRAIRQTSGAQAAQATAIQNQVVGGFGAWRIVLEDDNGSPRIIHERIPNPLTVVPDPDAKAISFRDMRRCTVYADLPKAIYEARYPKGKAVSVGESEIREGWTETDTVRVAEFWEIKDDKKVYQTILDGAGILSETEHQHFRKIPVFFLAGEEYDVEGEKILSGVIRYAKEPQQFKNFWKSEEYEYLSGMKQPPALMTPEMVSDPLVAATWGPGSEAGAYRLYQLGPNGEKPLCPAAPQIPTGYANASAEATEEFRQATGIYSVHLGAPSSQSGKALLVQEEQADVSTWIYEHHLKELIEYEGEVLLDLLPLFSTESVIALAAEDGSLESKEIEAIQGLREDLKGLNGGTYGVRVTVGPNWTSKSEKFASRISEMGTKNPLIAQIAAPELILALDIPGKEKLAKDVRAYLEGQGLRKPDVDEKEAQSKIPQILEALQKLQQELERTTQERDAIAQELQSAQQGEQSAIAKAQLDAQATIEKAQIDAAARIEAARIAAEADKEIALIREHGANVRKDAELTSAAETVPAVVVPVGPETIALEGVI